MAYDEKLAERLETVLKGKKGVTRKKMFGGLCCLLNGNMFCGIVKDELMVRVGPEAHNKAVSQKYARVMDFTGKPMIGFIYVAPAGLKTAAGLRKWIGMSLDFVGELPKKKK